MGKRERNNDVEFLMYLNNINRKFCLYLFYKIYFIFVFRIFGRLVF